MFKLDDHMLIEIAYFVDRQCLPVWRLPRKIMRHDDLTYIYKGKGTYLINDVPYDVKQGDLVYIPSGSIREAYTDSCNPICCYAFNFNCKTIEDENIILPFKSISKIGIDYNLIDMYQQFNGLWVEKDEGYLLKGKAIFMLILHRLIYLKRLVDGSSTYDLRIEKVKKYILENYNEKLYLKDLAKIAELNPVYFGTYFKKVVGCSVNDYINTIRVNKAKDLLSTGGYNVGEAGRYTGFDDIYYFSKIFKKITGLSPSSLIKNR